MLLLSFALPFLASDSLRFSPTQVACKLLGPMKKEDVGNYCTSTALLL